MRLDLPLLAPESRPLDFLAVGEIGLDLIALTPSWPEPDEKLRLGRLAELPGGQAASAAVGCARLGWRSGFAGVVGDDSAGDILAASLDREHVRRHLIFRSGVPTRRAVVLVDEASGARTVLEQRDSRLDAVVAEFGAETFSSARLVLVDGTNPALAREVIRLARDGQARIMADVDSPTHEAMGLLRLVDVAVVPLDFARAMTGAADGSDAVRLLALRIPDVAVVVVTMGELGAVAASAGKVTQAPGEPTDLIDTTGAGDAFRAGFAFAWLAGQGRGLELEAALRTANCVAALSCRGLGAQTSLPTRAEVEAWCNRSV